MIISKMSTHYYYNTCNIDINHYLINYLQSFDGAHKSCALQDKESRVPVLWLEV